MNSKYEEYLRKKKDYDKYSTENQIIIDKLDKEIAHYHSEAERIEYNLDNCEEILKELSEEFRYQTSLSKEDFAFLFLAVGLQLIRQNFTKFAERTSHDVSEIDSKVKQKDAFDKIGKGADSSSKRFYYASTEAIVSSPGVPYDAVKGSKAFNVGGGLDNNLGLSGDTHRIKTLGHDPILGYVFGTCNIMTSTLTTTSFKTFHISSGSVVNNGNTGLMLKYSANRCLNDPQALVVSLVKQYFHIQSDMYSHDGIQLPFISVASTEAVKWLNDVGLDFANVLTIGKQAGLAILINKIVYMLYCLTNINGNKSIVSVKGNKIVTYANIIASSSNVVKVMITQNMRDLDVGGIIVTIYQIIKNRKIQQEIRDEFVYGGYERMLELRKYIETEEI